MLIANVHALFSAIDMPLFYFYSMLIIRLLVLSSFLLKIVIKETC